MGPSDRSHRRPALIKPRTKPAQEQAGLSVNYLPRPASKPDSAQLIPILLAAPTCQSQDPVKHMTPLCPRPDGGANPGHCHRAAHSLYSPVLAGLLPSPRPTSGQATLMMARRSSVFAGALLQGCWAVFEVLGCWREGDPLLFVAVGVFQRPWPSKPLLQLQLWEGQELRDTRVKDPEIHTNLQKFRS